MTTALGGLPRELDLFDHFIFVQPRHVEQKFRPTFFVPFEEYAGSSPKMCGHGDRNQVYAKSSPKCPWPSRLHVLAFFSNAISYSDLLEDEEPLETRFSPCVKDTYFLIHRLWVWVLGRVRTPLARTSALSFPLPLFGNFVFS